jgi:hypothetical protein
VAAGLVDDTISGGNSTSLGRVPAVSVVLRVDRLSDAVDADVPAYAANADDARGIRR